MIGAMRLNDFVREFAESLRVAFEPDLDLAAAIQHALRQLECVRPYGKEVRQDSIFAHLNKKFDFNHDRVKRLLTHAAKRGVVFNYHEKNEIALAFDYGNA